MKPAMKMELARLKTAEAREHLREAFQSLMDAMEVAELGDPDDAKPSDHEVFDQWTRELAAVCSEFGFELRRVPEEG